MTTITKKAATETAPFGEKTKPVLQSSRNELGISVCEPNSVCSYPSINIDYKLYEHYFTDADISEEQKRELFETLCSIMLAFVDLGFGVHPLQQACEQNEIYCEITHHDLENLLKSVSIDQIKDNASGADLKSAFDGTATIANSEEARR